MGKDWKKYYDYKKRPNEKWVQKDGNNCDYVTFTNGEIEVGFEEWLEIIYQ